MPIRMRPQLETANKQAATEAARTGNSTNPISAEWLDPSIAGFTSKEDWWSHYSSWGAANGLAAQEEMRD